MPIDPPPPYEGNEPYIFVSYSRADKQIVYDDIDYLTNDRPYRIWYDEAILPGDPLTPAIESHIDGCCVMLVFISSNSMESTKPWVRKELRRANRVGKSIIPVFLNDVEHLHVHAAIRGKLYG